MPEQEIEDPIQAAFEKFKTRKDYERAKKAMEEKGMRQPYLDNVFLTALAYGYLSAMRKNFASPEDHTVAVLSDFSANRNQ
jgi:hypothetical protein